MHKVCTKSANQTTTGDAERMHEQVVAHNIDKNRIKYIQTKIKL